MSIIIGFSTKMMAIIFISVLSKVHHMSNFILTVGMCDDLYSLKSEKLWPSRGTLGIIEVLLINYIRHHGLNRISL